MLQHKDPSEEMEQLSLRLPVIYDNSQRASRTPRRLDQELGARLGSTDFCSLFLYNLAQSELWVEVLTHLYQSELLSRTLTEQLIVADKKNKRVEEV